MNSIKGIGYALWWRSRWSLLVAVCILWASSAYFVTVGREHMNGPIGILLFFGNISSILMIIGICLYQDADVAVKGSAYPVYMLSLPVRTGLLTLYPMAMGSLLILATCVPLERAVQQGNSSFTYWPAFLLMAMLASLQAIFWFPFGFAYSKLLLTLISLVGLSVYAGKNLSTGIADSSLCLNFSVFTLTCYVVAYLGLTKARHGDSWNLFPRSLREGSVGRTRSKPPRKVLPPFRSGESAQRWYEWRQHGIILPLFSILLFALFVLPLQWNTTYSSVPWLGQVRNGYYLSVPTYATIYFPTTLGVMLFVAWIVGCGARRSDSKHTDRTFHLFFGVRPLSDETMFAQKIRSAAQSTLVAWGITLFLCLFLAGMKATYTPVDFDKYPPIGQEQPLLIAASPFFTLGWITKAAAVLCLLLIATWRNYIVGFWSELSGSKALYYGYPVACILGVFIIPAILGNWRWLGDFFAPNGKMVEAIWLVCGVRLIVAGLVANRLLKAGTISVGSLARLFATIGGFACLVIGLTLFLFRSNFGDVAHNYDITPDRVMELLVGFILLWTPIVRILLGIHFLSANRHRVA